MGDDATFDTVLLFDLEEWTKREVQECLDENEVQGEVRHGFSHLVVVCDGDLNPTSMRGQRRFLAVRFDHETQQAEQEGLVVSKDAAVRTPLHELITEANNVRFDLSTFGVSPTGGSSLIDLYQAVRAESIHSVDLLKESECGDLIEDESLDHAIRKLLLDIVALRAAFAVTLVKLHSPPPREGEPRGVATEYAIALTTTFMSRAMIEKLMILTAMVDPKLDASALETGRRMKTKFLKIAEESALPLTARVATFVESVELLDDKYRTPEVHKRGRLLGLVHQGYYATALNEILSFQNKAHGLFVDICQELRGGRTAIRNPG